MPSGPSVGPEDSDSVTALRELASQVRVLEEQGRYREARAEARCWVELAENSAGRESIELASALHGLAGIQARLAEYDLAEAGYRRALAIRIAKLGNEHAAVARSLSNLAGLLRLRGRYGAALPHAQRALVVHERALGAGHSATLGAVSELALVKSALGDYVSAVALLEDVEQHRRTRGDDSELAAAIANLAMVRHQMGRYRDAEHLYQEALKLRRRALPDGHPAVATTLINLGALLRIIDDPRAAEPLYTEALAIRRRAFGEDSLQVASALIGLAAVYLEGGDPDRAEPLLRKALAQARASAGQDHIMVAMGINALALVHTFRRDYAQALPLYVETLAMYRRLHGEDGRSVARAARASGDAHRRVGQLAKAERRYRESIAIWRRILGTDNPDLARTLVPLAEVLVVKGRREEAHAALAEAVEINNRLAADLALLGPEMSRVQYLRGIRRDEHLLLSLAVGKEDANPVGGGAVAELLLRRKGLTAEAGVAVRRGDSPRSDHEPKRSALLAVRAELATLALSRRRGEDAGPDPTRTRELEGTRNALEAELARELPAHEIGAGLRRLEVDRIRAALAPNAALVEFARFRFFDPTSRAAQFDLNPGRERYLACVIRGLGDPDPLVVDLGWAKPIDRRVDWLVRAIEREGRRLLVGSAVSERKSHDHARWLRDVLVAPLAPAVANVEQLYLAPDGELSRLPFELVWADETQGSATIPTTSYLDVGRSLLRLVENEDSAAGSAPLVLADPDFDLASADAAATPTAPGAGLARDLRSTLRPVNRLEGTRAEGEGIGDILGIECWFGRRVLDGAVKTRLTERPSPRILHIATHAVFLADEQRAAEGEGGMAPADGSWTLESNPLLRSGFLLAGFNTWLAGRDPGPRAEDGLLTSEDIAALNLSETRLAVLSACETGRGHVEIGEGVFGLRRAFVLAGARALVLSLWKVPDAATALLMRTLYGGLEAGKPLATALKEGKRAVREKHPHPFFWGAFVIQGDAGPVSWRVEAGCTKPEPH